MESKVEGLYEGLWVGREGLKVGFISRMESQFASLFTISPPFLSPQGLSATILSVQHDLGRGKDSMFFIVSQPCHLFSPS